MLRCIYFDSNGREVAPAQLKWLKKDGNVVIIKLLGGGRWVERVVPLSTLYYYEYWSENIIFESEG